MIGNATTEARPPRFQFTVGSVSCGFGGQMLVHAGLPLAHRSSIITYHCSFHVALAGASAPLVPVARLARAAARAEANLGSGSAEIRTPIQMMKPPAQIHGTSG